MRRDLVRDCAFLASERISQADLASLAVMSATITVAVFENDEVDQEISGGATRARTWLRA